MILEFFSNVCLWIKENIGWVGAFIGLIIVIFGIFKKTKNKLFAPKISIEPIEYDYANITNSRGADFHWLRVKIRSMSKKEITNCKLKVTSIRFYDEKLGKFIEKLGESVLLPWAHPDIQIAPQYVTQIDADEVTKTGFLFKFADNSILEFSRDSDGRGMTQFFDTGVYEVIVSCFAENAKGDQAKTKVIYERAQTLPRVEAL